MTNLLVDASLIPSVCATLANVLRLTLPDCDRLVADRPTDCRIPARRTAEEI